MAARMVRRGPWQVPVKVLDCLCSDGVRRVATITGAPDTYFSIPARVTVKGKTVSGFVMTRSGFEDDYEFVAYTYRKNGNLLPM